MRKLILSSALCAMSIFALAQVPQGMTYQAVIHNSTGTPVANTTLQVKAGILSDTTTPVVVYEELHSTVKTNASGVMNIIIGSGVRQSGSASSFGAIDWTNTPLFLKIQVFYQNAWKSISAAKLWSVPYAMAAEDISGTLSKLSVTGVTSDMEEALFEVKNKDGQTVFAVYNEGVRIFVDNGSKGAKGGFSVGGFGTEKAPSQKLLYVDPDSIRAYIYTDDGKATKGGFTIGGFGGSKLLPEEYLRVTRDSTRVYLQDSEGKGNKGGFAIGGFGAAKEETENLFFVNSDSSRFYVTKLEDGSSSTFNIIGFGPGQRKALLTANADTVGIEGVLALQNDLIVGGNISLGGDVKPIAKDAIDGDGNVYATLILGNQVWMAENLRTTRYSDGSLIGTTALPGTDITLETTPRYQWPYNGLEANAASFGRLYTWYAATDLRNVCPAGYHLPSSMDWDELWFYLENNGYGYEGSGNDVAKSMASTLGWTPNLVAAGIVGNNTAANNTSGFNGLPAGSRDAYSSSFVNLSLATYWWGREEVEGSGLNFTFDNGSSTPSMNYESAYFGFSIRCVQNK